MNEENVEKDEMIGESKSSTGLTQNVAGALCYLAGFVTGIIFLVMEKENKFVRYHAYQSIIIWVSLFILSMVIGMIPVLGWVLSLLMTPVGVILWIYCMYQAYNGKEFELPIVGKMAKEQVAKN